MGHGVGDRDARAGDAGGGLLRASWARRQGARGEDGPWERADWAGVGESWAARAGLLAVGVWAGFQAGLGFLVLGFLFLSISISFTTNSN